MIRFLVRLLCLFVPVKTWRKAIRKKLAGTARRTARYRKMMRRVNRITHWQTRQVGGIKVQSGVLPNGKTICFEHAVSKDRALPNHIVEVFGDAVYNFAANGESVVIDIGMNVGLASLYFAMRDDVVAVYGYEPVPETYEKALFNFGLNSYSNKIIPCNCGLGDANKECTIWHNDEHSGASTMIAEHGKGGADVKVQVRDAAVDIREIMDKHPGKNIVIKCDAEGAEKEIFERLAAADGLGGIDGIIMEYHFGYDEYICPLLISNGFVCFKMGGGQGMVRAVNQRNTGDNSL